MTNKELRAQIQIYLDGKIDLWNLCDFIYNRVHTTKYKEGENAFWKLLSTPLHAQCLVSDRVITLFEARDYIEKEFNKAK